jgi:Kef-type K+ transport system membrane component KefB
VYFLALRREAVSKTTLASLGRTLRLPEMIGLLLFGVLLGPHGLEFFGAQRPIADFFAELGKLLLMLSASRLTSNSFARRRRVPLA